MSEGKTLHYEIDIPSGTAKNHALHRMELITVILNHCRKRAHRPEKDSTYSGSQLKL